MNLRIFSLLAFILLFFGTVLMAGDFVDNGDGTVTDHNTNLMWQQGENGGMNWESALTCCEDLYLADFNDWRLPNVKELESITDESLYSPAIDAGYFPDVQGPQYWTSTTSVNNTTYAWHVGFDNASVHPGGIKTDNSHYVRCVRVGQ